LTRGRSALLCLEQIRKRPEAAGHILLFLDFDGTLAPIVNNPARACLPPATRAVLARLNRRKNVTIALVSGRAARDVRARVGLKMIYVGNHGLEIDGPGMHFRDSTAVSLAGELAVVINRIKEALSNMPGVIVENKGLTASVHFRQVDVARLGDIVGVVSREVGAVADQFCVRTGKKVFEIRPKTEWNKGSAVRFVRKCLKLEEGFPIAIGDDSTDEDMFASSNGGLNIKVGTGQLSRAPWRLVDCDEVAQFLRSVLDVL
jgi:trehalose-phosphatase